MTADVPAPIDHHRERVRPDWIDYNGHMNVAYYVLVFDHGTDVLFDMLDIGAGYRARSNCSLFAMEGHINYLAEVKEGDELRVTTQFLGHDDKRIHFFHRMYHVRDGYLAATSELLGLHVDLARRRASVFPPDVHNRLASLASAHAGLPRPPELGRVIALKGQG
jgi:acyl-CoA thioester hydrolase